MIIKLNLQNIKNIIREKYTNAKWSIFRKRKNTFLLKRSLFPKYS